MNEMLHSCLVTSSQVPIPLQGVRIEACLTGLGSEVTVTIVGLPPLMQVRMGFGSFGMYEALGRAEADVYGVFSSNIRVPYWGERDRVHFFFANFDTSGTSSPSAVARSTWCSCSCRKISRMSSAIAYSWSASHCFSRSR